MIKSLFKKLKKQKKGIIFKGCFLHKYQNAVKNIVILGIKFSKWY